MTHARLKFKYVDIIKKQILQPVREVSNLLNVIVILCCFTIRYENEGHQNNCLLMSVSLDGELGQIFFRYHLICP